MYEEEPTGSRQVESIREGTFAFGTGIEDCYRTQDGVGVAGVNADKGARAKGIPILWVFPMFIGLCSLCYFIPLGLAKFQEKALGPKKPKIESPVNSGSDSSPLPSDRPEPRRSAARYLTTYDGATIERYSVNGRSVFVELSDGTIYDQNSPSLGGVGPDYVIIDGEKIQYRPRRGSDVPDLGAQASAQPQIDSAPPPLPSPAATEPPFSDSPPGV